QLVRGDAAVLDQLLAEHDLPLGDDVVGDDQLVHARERVMADELAHPRRLQPQLLLHLAQYAGSRIGVILLQEAGDQREHLRRPGAVARQDDLPLVLDDGRDHRHRVVPVHELAGRAAQAVRTHVDGAGLQRRGAARAELVAHVGFPFRATKVPLWRTASRPALLRLLYRVMRARPRLRKVARKRFHSSAGRLQRAVKSASTGSTYSHSLRWMTMRASSPWRRNSCCSSAQPLTMPRVARLPPKAVSRWLRLGGSGASNSMRPAPPPVTRSCIAAVSGMLRCRYSVKFSGDMRRLLISVSAARPACIRRRPAGGGASRGSGQRSPQWCSLAPVWPRSISLAPFPMLLRLIPARPAPLQPLPAEPSRGVPPSDEREPAAPRPVDRDKALELVEAPKPLPPLRPFPQERLDAEMPPRPDALTVFIGSFLWVAASGPEAPGRCWR